MILLTGSLELCFASTYHIFHSPVLGICFVYPVFFGDIMCIWDSYVYQKGVLCFLIRECYIRSIKRYCFVRKYAAVPVQLEIVILQYTGWCVLIIRAFFFNQFSCFCQFLMDIIIIIIIIIMSVKNSLLSTHCF
jgi:hypothetical protein